ncbi:hypothetical protein WBJ53_27225 [Spirosoma sp. SC4-14]|uniref:hypothetical protein n=1 Tax=Spirosoma sp. SC4-14 TaxID=3128900 RepID=UPI0030CC0434
MPTYYPASLTCSLLLVYSVTVPIFAQQPADQLQPTTSISVKLSDFSLPPHSVELVSLSLSPEGTLHYQTLMPIGGRMAATTDEAKLKGALAPPAGVYVYTGAIDAQGQTKLLQAAVFAQPDARIKVAQDTPVDWAVWGTKASDGPLRLPFGGAYDQLLLPTLIPRQVKRVSFASNGSGLNYANYSLYPSYRIINRFIDPTSARLVSRLEDVPLQQAANQEKLPRYIPVEGDTPEERGRVIALSPTRFEGIATHFVEGDKGASAKKVSLLTFDEAGNLLSDQVIDFPYSRKLSMRLPVHDPAGQIVGTFTVFADAGGKKEVRDPEGNRFSVVVTDENGGIWSQFTWTNGEGSERAILPTYVLRRDDKLLVYSSNGQKMLKPTEESWLIDKAGKATLVNSLPYGQIADLSKAVGRVNGGQRTGWMNYAGGQYIDSFTDSSGDVWLLLQRQADTPGGRAVVSEPSTSSPTSKLIGFANKLNQIANQPTRAVAPATVTSESGKTYSDLFVLHFDGNLKLKEQTVVALEPTPEPVRFKRSVRSAGSDYVFNNAANTRLSMRGGVVSVQRLTPLESMPLTAPDRDNFLIDEASGKIYVLYGVPRKPGLAQLATYMLD